MFNGTLFLQIVHFCIGYCLLKHILLKPGLAVIQAQEAREQQLNYDIVALKNKLASHEVSKKELWRDCLRALLRDKPSLEMGMRHMIMRDLSEPLPEISIEQGEQIKQAAARRCRAWIMHERVT